MEIIVAETLREKKNYHLKNCYITKLRTEKSVCKERAKGRGSSHELARYVLLGANIIVMNSV